LFGRTILTARNNYSPECELAVHPNAADIGVTMDILQLFGAASGLKTNLQKK